MVTQNSFTVHHPVFLIFPSIILVSTSLYFWHHMFVLDLQFFFFPIGSARKIIIVNDYKLYHR